MADLRTGFATHEGQVRNQNEDNVHVGPTLFIVADGMGGHQAGEIASEMAVTRLRDRLGDGALHTIGDLVDAVTEANHDIYRSSVEQPDRNGMGTTVTALAVTFDPYDGEMLAVANVGDSRTYLVRHGRLRQVTVDHSLVQEMVAEGAITRDEARHHPRRNIVTRALGIGPSTRVDSWPVPLIRGDRFVLCSDGLVDEVHDDDIAAILAQHPDDPQAAAEALVDAANAAGGRDNVTVVVVDVLDGDDPPEPTEEIEVIPTWGADLDVTGEHPTPVTTEPPTTDHEPTDTPTDDGSATDEDPDQPSAAGDADDRSGTPPEGSRRMRPSGQVVRFLMVMGVSAVVVLGIAILAAWARQGYYVAFDDDGDVVIYQGRDLLWFQPTAEAPGPYGRDVLDDESIALVEARPTFESQASAAQFVASRLTPTTTTTTTTVPPTTTVAPTTTVPRTTTTTTAPTTTTTTGAATTTTEG